MGPASDMDIAVRIRPSAQLSDRARSSSSRLSAAGTSMTCAIRKSSRSQESVSCSSVSARAVRVRYSSGQSVSMTMTMAPARHSARTSLMTGRSRPGIAAARRPTRPCTDMTCPTRWPGRLGSPAVRATSRERTPARPRTRTSSCRQRTIPPGSETRPAPHPRTRPRVQCGIEVPGNVQRKVVVRVPVPNCRVHTEFSW